MGPSGCGKTTLAKFLQLSKPEKYKRITQITTRDPRKGEVEGNEYFFYTQEQYEELSVAGGMIAQVKEEFAPGMYGTPISLLDPTKINVIVSSIEGFLDSLNKLKDNDIASVLFIKNVNPETERPLRSYMHEEKYNRIVLHKLEEGKQKFNLIEIEHEHLKQIRNNKTLLCRFLTLSGVKN
jgi:guanylate kinase